LKSLRRLEIPIILMDTPYRLQRLVEDVKLVFGKQKKASLMTRLTQPGEMLFHGSIEKIQSQIKGQKAEFILILH